jgi:RNA polymerase sigma-70 factor (ECF subfamily)
MSLSFASAAQDGRPVEPLRRRDRPAWDRLVADEYGRVYNLHLRLTGDREAAADLTQETFVSAYRGAGTFRGQSRAEAWLYGVALNCNRNWLRREGRHDPPEELTDDLPDPEPTAEELAALRQQTELVCDAVRRLPESHRRVVVLRYFTGLSAVEIAAMEGVDDGTIRWRLHQAMRKLWVMLRPSLGEESQDEPGTNERLRIAP